MIVLLLICQSRQLNFIDILLAVVVLAKDNFRLLEKNNPCNTRVLEHSKVE